MPLRVAEKNGYIYGVSRCCDCPFLINYGADSMRDVTLLRCSYGEEEKEALMPNSIPVWCPLPREEYTELKILKPENKLDVRSDYRHIERKENA